MSTDTQPVKPADSTPPKQNEDGGSGDPWWKPTLAGAVTIISLIAFFAFIIYLLPRTGDADLTWTRSMYLLTGVEAITFAAVGWLFGKEVHRAQAQAAEKRADDAQQQRDEAVKQAANERATGATTAELALAAVTEASASATLPSSLRVGHESRRAGAAVADRPNGYDGAPSPAVAAFIRFVDRHYPNAGAR